MGKYSLSVNKCVYLAVCQSAYVSMGVWLSVSICLCVYVLSLVKKNKWNQYLFSNMNLIMLSYSSIYNFVCGLPIYLVSQMQYVQYKFVILNIAILLIA